jgi:MFS family permease
MQNVAQAWLVTEITHPNEAIWLGRVTAIQFLPIMIFSLFAGALIDRFSKKKVLIFAQTVMMVLAFVLALDIYLKTVVLWHVLLIAWLLGCANTLDMPTRQAFMIELVGKEELTNAIVLNSSIFNVARMAGPAIAGVAIARWGMDACFFLNAVSFIPVIIGIAMIRLTITATPRSELTEKKSVLGEMGEGLAYVWKTPGLLIPMALLAVVNIFVFNFNVLIPLYARRIFHGDAQVLGFLMSAFGIGAVIGTVLLALRSGAGRKPKFKLLALAAIMVCVFELITTPIRSFPLVSGLLVLIGFALISFTITANSLIQMQAPNYLRGRIMSIYSFVLMGISPIGSYWSGAAAQRWNAPITMGIGAAIALVLILGLLGVRMSLLRRRAA